MARKVGIYLMRKHTGLTNREIGEPFGKISYSAVAKVQERFSGQLSTDRSSRQTTQEIRAKMSHVKPWPSSYNAGSFTRCPRLQITAIL